jgi:NADPH:quinone reductase-like Zn-dependent oxidoreductase
MQGVVYSRYGEPADVLRIGDLDDPVAATGEVLVRVRATPFLYGSLLAVRGRYRGPGDTTSEPPAGGRQGYEGVGVVEAIGRGVAPDGSLRIGQRVSFFPAPGAWAERISVPEEFVTAVPDDIPDHVAAQLHINPLTAVMLFRAALEAGVAEGSERAIVVDAGGSSVAKFVTAIAERRSVLVVSVVRRREAAALLASQFPRATFVASSEDGWPSSLQTAAPPGGLFVGLDAVGGPVGSAVLDSIAPGGTLITYGDPSGEPLQANALSFALRDTHVHGLVVTRWPGHPEAERRKDIDLSLELARTRPDLFPVAAQFPLTQVAAAARKHAMHFGRDFDAWVDLFAEDAVLEFPHFASLGWPTETRGRESIRADLGPFLQSVDDFFLRNVRVYEATDPDTVFAEYNVQAVVKSTGRRYDQSYIAVLTTRDGKIVRLREFPDTITVARAFLPNGLADLTS